MILLWFGIHQFINKDLQVVRSPSIILWVFSFILYFAAIVLYRAEALTFVFKLHEILIVTLFGFIVAWVYSHLRKSIDTMVYTSIIVVLSIILVFLTISNYDNDVVSMMYIVRLILTALLVGVGADVVWRQYKSKQMENFPLLYLFAFGYWITIAYWF
ncbi:hypothetical protein MTQ89_08905 [Staphylococcus hyicus]|uniref:hypothetical protein n=1 Tax=Staphylococcus hyicus TaxID=1284 RepID=UPI00208FA42B|nr:hypothetical protein [Staphylococcus hyicus]MCO4328796.1 hypothetical protein [Staphylococcus hyicus]MCO4336858.1 hypothetical protein [Staphylococcus hyicus]